GHQGDHGILGLPLKFRTMGSGKPGPVARELDDRHLHAKTDTEIGDALLPRIARRLDLALDAAFSESAGYQHRVGTLQQHGTIGLDLLRIDVADTHPR